MTGYNLFKALNLRPLIGFLLISLAFAAIAMYRPADGQQSGPLFRLTILHTNDLHAHDQSFVEHGRVVGGLSRIGQLIRRIRQSNANTLVVDAGDIFQGTPFFTIYHGEVEVHLLNEIGYNLFTIGNHEFDQGPGNLSEQLKKAKFSILSSNLDCSQFPKLQELVEPSEVKTIDGQKIGFVGAITPDLEEISLSRGPIKLKMSGSSWLVPIKTEIARLRSEGINKIIVISHCGLERDKEMAAAIDDIDAIVGGHSHTRLDKPLLFEHPGSGTTIIVQTGCYGRALGKLDLAFDRDGKLVFPATTYHLINITERLPEAPDLKAYIASKSGPISALKEVILSNATANFRKDWQAMPWDSALGDLIADALYEAAKPDGAEISFLNRGGIRAAIGPGPITAEQVEELLPFDNKLMVATVPGGTILNLLEHSLSASLGGKFLDEHGLKVAYDPQHEVGHRLVFALAKAKDGSWVPVDRSKNYRIAINSYSFSGGEGYDLSAAADKVCLPHTLTEIFKEYLQEHPSVTAQPSSRIVAVDDSLVDARIERGKLEIRLHHIPPGAKIIVFGGTALGVESCSIGRSRSVPVPLANPKLVGQWQVEKLAKAENVDNIHVNSFDCVRFFPRETVAADLKFVTAVVFPANSQSDHKLTIASPTPVLNER